MNGNLTSNRHSHLVLELLRTMKNVDEFLGIKILVEVELLNAQRV